MYVLTAWTMFILDFFYSSMARKDEISGEIHFFGLLIDNSHASWVSKITSYAPLGDWEAAVACNPHYTLIKRLV